MADEDLRALERAWRRAKTWWGFVAWARACDRAGDPVPASFERLLVRWNLRDLRADRVILYRARHSPGGDDPRATRLDELQATCDGAATLAHDAVRRVLREFRRRGVTTAALLAWLEGAPLGVAAALTRYVQDAARRKRERRDGRWRPADRPRLRGRICAGCVHPLHESGRCEGLVLDSIAGARCECLEIRVADDGWIPAESWLQPRVPEGVRNCPDCPHRAHDEGSCGGTVPTLDEGVDPSCPCETSSEPPYYGPPSWLPAAGALLNRFAGELRTDGCVRCQHRSHDGVPCVEWVTSTDASHPYHCPCPSLGPIFANDRVPEVVVFVPGPAGRLTAEQEARIRQRLLEASRRGGHRALVLDDLPEGSRVWLRGREPEPQNVPADSTRIVVGLGYDPRNLEVPQDSPVFPTTGTPVVHDGNAWAAGQTITLEGELPPAAITPEAPRTTQNCPRCAGSATVAIGSTTLGASYGSCSECGVDVEFRADGTNRLLPASPSPEAP